MAVKIWVISGAYAKFFDEIEKAHQVEKERLIEKTRSEMNGNIVTLSPGLYRNTDSGLWVEYLLVEAYSPKKKETYTVIYGITGDPHLLQYAEKADFYVTTDFDEYDLEEAEKRIKKELGTGLPLSLEQAEEIFYEFNLVPEYWE